MTDLGLDVVNFIFEKFQVDQEWSVRTKRGFKWWAESLMQEVWAGPVFQEDGFDVWRVDVRTELFRGFPKHNRQIQLLSTLAAGATVAGPVLHDDDPSRVLSATSFFVHRENFDWVHKLATWATIIQVIEARTTADSYAEMLLCEPCLSGHPTSGRRRENDDLLNVIDQLIKPQGEGPCRWLGPEMEWTGELMDQPPCLLAEGSFSGLTAEYPFGAETSLILAAEMTHPKMGNGLLVTLKLPVKAEEDESAPNALELNRIELTSLTRIPFLGSWCNGTDGWLTYSMFLPNVLHRKGLLPNLLIAMAIRARWVTEQVFGLDLEEHFEEALENKMKQMDQMEFLLGMLGDDPEE